MKGVLVLELEASTVTGLPGVDGAALDEVALLVAKIAATATAARAAKAEWSRPSSCGVIPCADGSRKKTISLFQKLKGGL